MREDRKRGRPNLLIFKDRKFVWRAVWWTWKCI